MTILPSPSRPCRPPVFRGEPRLDASRRQECLAVVPALDDGGFGESFGTPSLGRRHHGDDESGSVGRPCDRIDDVMDLDAATRPTADECRAGDECPYLTWVVNLSTLSGVFDGDRPASRRRVAGPPEVAAERHDGEAARRSTSPVTMRSAARPFPMPPRSMRSPPSTGGVAHPLSRRTSASRGRRPLDRCGAVRVRPEPPRTNGRIRTLRACRGSSGRRAVSRSPPLVAACERTPEAWADLDVTTRRQRSGSTGRSWAETDSMPARGARSPRTPSRPPHRGASPTTSWATLPIALLVCVTQ